ncbi:DUF4097 family beta strand repeat-containing protein [Companilactobacillus ginsenosidimutans]|uniref:DUF4097 domain-containing protein n=1 Tax=Companilactobacillus ginsenosidimutans TaxID=1007676 RepID=A0A0H4QCU5_9LACO|nr:DUF4097 family beta strand repeat-containing protein [Companilactobacillus ginsenosidimutans]AKP66154.1 hypothetical protein ABM34_00385 [Companilactobacillus ginsenosidimutans]
MKKILLIVLVVLIVIVVAVFGIQAAGMRANLNTLSIKKVSDQSIELPNELNSVDIKVRTAKVTIEKGNKSEVIIKNKVVGQYKIDSKDNQVSILEQNYGKHQLEIGKSASILIRVKNAQNMNQIKINQLNGTLNLNSLKVNNLSVDHQNGTTLANNLNLPTGGSINKKNGTTNLKNINTPGLKVSVKSGNFELNGRKKASSKHTYTDNSTKQLQINSGSGQVKISTVK